MELMIETTLLYGLKKIRLLMQRNIYNHLHIKLRGGFNDVFSLTPIFGGK